MVQAWYSHKNQNSIAKRQILRKPLSLVIMLIDSTLFPLLLYPYTITASVGGLLKQQADERQANVLHGGIEQKIRRLK